VHQVLQTKIRVGVIPLEALCSDAHLLWTSCRDERSWIVSGVKNYPLWRPECRTLVDNSQPHAPAKPDCLQFFIVVEKRRKCLKLFVME
jgi:hypothetical protein